MCADDDRDRLLSALDVDAIVERQVLGVCSLTYPDFSRSASSLSSVDSGLDRGIATET